MRFQLLALLTLFSLNAGWLETQEVLSESGNSASDPTVGTDQNGNHIVVWFDGTDDAVYFRKWDLKNNKISINEFCNF